MTGRARDAEENEASPFWLRMEVRDSEIDETRVVGNAHYLFYFQHARHVFLRRRLLGFSDLARAGIALVLARAELHFLRPLVGGDEFEVSVSGTLLSPVRIELRQELVRLPDRRVCARLRATATALDEARRPRIPPQLRTLFN